MRHRIAGRKLSRKHGHRKALFKNLISALIIHGEIRTTESKAKSVRRLVEKVITKGKAGTLHTRRLIAAFLQNRGVVNKLIDEVAPLFKNRPGGYTRIVRLGRRRGDNAMMVKLELVEKPTPKEKEKTEKTQPEIVKQEKKSKFSSFRRSSKRIKKLKE